LDAKSLIVSEGVAAVALVEIGVLALFGQRAKCARNRGAGESKQHWAAIFVHGAKPRAGCQSNVKTLFIGPFSACAFPSDGVFGPY
jgi:hypothetical protein